MIGTAISEALPMGLQMPIARELSGRGRYNPPREMHSVRLRDLVRWTGRGDLEPSQLTLLSGRRDDPDVDVFYSGSLNLLKQPAVSIVGTREVSDEGWRRAQRLARELASAKVLVVRGLAKGVDTAALTGAIDAGGSTAAVIGTPLNKAYPVENADLQTAIYQDHLLLSPFRSASACSPRTSRNETG
jgi:DNA processing protein